MAYSENKKPGELTALTSLATDDVFVVGDTSDASEVAKYITKANLITDLTTSFATALGADDNYVTDAEKTKLSNLSGTNTGDQTSIVGITGTKAQFDTSCSDGNFLYVGDVTGISDGDKGDITVSASGATWTIDSGAVSLAKQADMATASVVYRKTAGTGVPEVQTLATLKTDLGLTGTNSGDQTSIVGITGTLAQFNTAVTDADLARTDAANTFTGTQTITQIDLGNVDTSITRASAGIIAVEGVNQVNVSTAQSLTNKDLTHTSNSFTAASTTQSGVAEASIASEVNTGTDAARYVSPDSLAGSNFGIRYVVATLNATTALTTSEKAYFRIPSALNGTNLVSVSATVGTGAAGASSSGTPTFTVKNVTDSNQMLSTSLTVDATEYTSATAVTPVVINTSFDDVVTDDLIEIACTTAGTGVTYATITLGFQLP